MRIDSMEDLMVDQLRDLYAAERLIIAEMPAVIHEAFSPSLRQALMDHLEEGAGQVARLGRVFEILGATSLGARSPSMQALVSQTASLIDRGRKGSALDAAIIAYVERIEHYQIAAYCSAISFARVLGYGTVADFLEHSLREEERAAEGLSHIALQEVNELAAHGVSSE